PRRWRLCSRCADAVDDSGPFEEDRVRDDAGREDDTEPHTNREREHDSCREEQPGGARGRDGNHEAHFEQEREVVERLPEQASRVLYLYRTEEPLLPSYTFFPYTTLFRSPATLAALFQVRVRGLLRMVRCHRPRPR